MCHDNFSQQERRRSARLIAQEERKENERKALLESARNKPQNLQANKKDKGKRVIEIDDDDLIDDSDYEDERNVSTRKKGRKRIALSSFQGGQHREKGMYDVNDMPQKHVFEFVLDLLQRIDRNEFFAQPVNPNEVDDYYDIIKQPMDFGTMRAKLQENMYTTLEQLEHDVHLMCNNAMTFNGRNSVYYRVACMIMDRARSIFGGLRANPERIELETVAVKRRGGSRRPRARSNRSVRLPTKHHEGVHGAQLEDRRNTYWSQEDNSLISQVLQGPKQSFILNFEALPDYEESLTEFGQGLGPVAQNIIKRKLETMRFYKLLRGQTASQNRASSSSAQGITQQRPATQTQHLASYSDLSLSRTQQLAPPQAKLTDKQNQASSSNLLLPRIQLLTPQATKTQRQTSYIDLLLPPQAKPIDKQNQASSSNLLLPHTQLLTPQATKKQCQTSYIDLLLSPQEKPTDKQHQTSYSDLLFSPTQQLTPQAKITDKQHQTFYSDFLFSPTQQLSPQAKTTDKQHQTSYSDLLLSPIQQLTPQAKTTDKQHQISYSDIFLSPTQQLNQQAKSSDKHHQPSYIDLLLAPSQQLNPPQATTTTPTQQNKASYNEIMLCHTQLHAPQTRPTPLPEPSYSDFLPANAFPLSNRPLSIPGAAAAAAQNKNVSTNIEQSTRVRDKGKAICVDQDNYNATAAALLGSIFLNYDKGKSSSTYQGEASSSINIRRPLQYDLNNDVNTSNPSMEAPIQVYGQDRILRQNRNLLQLSAYNNNANSGQCSNPLGMSDALQSNLLGRPSRVRSLVWPTRVISGPQPNQSHSSYAQSLLSQPFLPNNSQADCSYGSNYSAPSQLSLQSSSTGLISDTNSIKQAIWPPKAVDQTYWLSSPTGVISDTNSRRQAILPPKAADQTSWLSSLSENFQQLLGSSYNSSPLSELNTRGYSGTDLTTPSYGHGGMGLTSFAGYGRRARLQGRIQEGSTSRLPWNEKDHPELALQL